MASRKNIPWRRYGTEDETKNNNERPSSVHYEHVLGSLPEGDNTRVKKSTRFRFQHIPAVRQRNRNGDEITVSRSFSAVRALSILRNDLDDDSEE